MKNTAWCGTVACGWRGEPQDLHEVDGRQCCPRCGSINVEMKIYTALAPRKEPAGMSDEKKRNEVDFMAARAAIAGMNNVLDSMAFAPPETQGMHLERAADALNDLGNALGLLPPKKVKLARDITIDPNGHRVDIVGQLSGSEAAFGVLAALTCRHEPQTFSRKHDASFAAKFAGEFCAVNKLPEPRGRWADILVHPPEPGVDNQAAKHRHEPTVVHCPEHACTLHEQCLKATRICACAECERALAAMKSAAPEIATASFVDIAKSPVVREIIAEQIVKTASREYSAAAKLLGELGGGKAPTRDFIERKTNDYTAMSGGELFDACGDSGERWAIAFDQHARKLGVIQVERWGGGGQLDGAGAGLQIEAWKTLDQGWLIGWFANAIEVACVARARRDRRLKVLHQMSRREREDQITITCTCGGSLTFNGEDGLDADLFLDSHVGCYEAPSEAPPKQRPVVHVGLSFDAVMGTFRLLLPAAADGTKAIETDRERAMLVALLEHVSAALADVARQVMR